MENIVILFKGLAILLAITVLETLIPGSQDFWFTLIALSCAVKYLEKNDNN